ncbi:hypothetical protein AURDEDRAFT_125934 [Auricularia subglabra TFB-10046 SS5]|nr:hypothetical protein AURDEDRAFT_125934 [Auricularia subglabra TFB-10046 SS5]
MFFANPLLVAISFAAAGFAQLPANGIYNIVNRETGFRWDVRGSNSGARPSLVFCAPLLTSLVRSHRDRHHWLPPGDAGQQPEGELNIPHDSHARSPLAQWNATLVTIVDDSGIYTLTAIDPDLSAYVNGVRGNPLKVQEYKTPFYVSQRVAGDQAFFITIPDVDENPTLAVTSPASDTFAIPLSLEPFSGLNNRQVWTFEATTV